MVYELAHLIKKRFGFVWDCVEWGNSELFALFYKNRLQDCEKIINDGVEMPFQIRLVGENDIEKLRQFFLNQPDDAFTYFQPHGFDRDSLLKIVHNHSFLAYVLIETSGDTETVIGYCFLRSFINGSSYRGYMVDYRNRGRGLAKIMGAALNRVGDYLGLSMYKSISPNNPASLKATQAVCNVEVIKKLKNGDELLKCMSKKAVLPNVNGGGTDVSFPRIILKFHEVLEPQFFYSYAA